MVDIRTMKVDGGSSLVVSSKIKYYKDQSKPKQKNKKLKGNPKKSL
jgi:hypothetical protein